MAFYLSVNRSGSLSLPEKTPSLRYGGVSLKPNTSIPWNNGSAPIFERVWSDEWSDEFG